MARREPERVAFRASAHLVNRLDELAKAHGGNRSKAIKAAILAASDPERADGVPDEHEVLLLLSESARMGNVSAMKELRAYHREQAGQAADLDLLGGLDELASRRKRRRRKGS